MLARTFFDYKYKITSVRIEELDKDLKKRGREIRKLKLQLGAGYDKDA